MEQQSNAGENAGHPLSRGLRGSCARQVGENDEIVGGCAELVRLVVLNNAAGVGFRILIRACNES
jgi:hypothetical protein